MRLGREKRTEGEGRRREVKRESGRTRDRAVVGTREEEEEEENHVAGAGREGGEERGEGGHLNF